MRLPDLPRNVGTTAKTKRLWYLGIATATATLVWALLEWAGIDVPAYVTAAVSGVITAIAAVPDV